MVVVHVEVDEERQRSYQTATMADDVFTILCLGRLT